MARLPAPPTCLPPLGVGGQGAQGRGRATIGRGTITLSRPSLAPDLRPPYCDNPTVRVILGPHQDRFTEEGVHTFLSNSYEITADSNRMGYRLEGPKIAHTRGPDLVSCGIPLGGIQVPGNGQPIVLMADHQTTGGYTMIATVIQADIPLVAQCIPGEKLRFAPWIRAGQSYRLVGDQGARRMSLWNL